MGVNSTCNINSKKRCSIINIKSIWGFSGGIVVKNPPASTGDMGSSPGPGRSHMCRATKPLRHNY